MSTSNLGIPTHTHTRFYYSRSLYYFRCVCLCLLLALFIKICKSNKSWALDFLYIKHDGREMAPQQNFMLHIYQACVCENFFTASLFLSHSYSENRSLNMSCGEVKVIPADFKYLKPLIGDSAFACYDSTFPFCFVQLESKVAWHIYKIREYKFNHHSSKSDQ